MGQGTVRMLAKFALAYTIIVVGGLTLIGFLIYALVEVPR
jgi:hypothetical protein